MSRTVTVRRWWRLVFTDVMGAMFIDDSESREDALARATELDRNHPGWPPTRVIEFVERGRDREVEYIR